MVISYVGENMKQSNWCYESSLDKKYELNILSGFKVEYHKHEIALKGMIETHHFLSSLTILFNSFDILKNSLSQIVDSTVILLKQDICYRESEHGEKNYNVPIKEMIAYAILNHLNANGS